jgi:hypothetical protein
MPQKSIAVALLVAWSAVAVAQEQSTRPTDQRPHLSIFTSAFCAKVPHEAELVRAFASDPSLAAIRTQCHWHHYTPNDPIYKERFRKIIPPDRLPAVLLQRADGGYVYKATGSNVPNSAAELFDEMAHYASLDPLKTPADSIEARPYSSWATIMQSGLDGIPDVDGPPQDCPDGNCPLPDSVAPVTPAAGPALPDSAELLGGRQPIRNAGAAVIWIIGGVVALALCAGFGVLFLGVIYLVVKSFKTF